MTRLDSLNALLARAIFASTWSDKRDTTLAPTLQAGARKVSGTKTNDLKAQTPVPDAQPVRTRAENQTAKRLRKTEVSFKKD
jgi:hypothetical protein